MRKYWSSTYAYSPWRQLFLKFEKLQIIYLIETQNSETSNKFWTKFGIESSSDPNIS